MAASKKLSPSGPVAPAVPALEDDRYFDYWEGKPPTPLGITVFWQNTKAFHFPWLSYGGMYKPSDDAFEIYFDSRIVRGTLTKSKKPYPFNELWKAIEQKYLYALWDMPARGLQVRVYQLVKTPEGETVEEPL